ncbi:MAG: YihY family inner membrane protein [Gammaproteobacteria bacterium]|nr:YihY family inner membrane protein [Gammaproteobacteria bacterium]
MSSFKRTLFARPQNESLVPAALRSTGQTIWLLLHDAVDGELDRHARALVYSTLIAMIPLLAFAVIALKALGVREVLAPALHRLLEPLGPAGFQLADKLLTVVSQVHIGLLGTFGIVLFAFAVVMLLFKIESGFDAAWRVTDARFTLARSLQYVGLLIAGPVLLFAAFGVTATLTSSSVVEHLSIVGDALPVLGKILPYLIAIVAFTLLNLIAPNARVHFRAALIAGFAGGIVWQAVGQLFAFLTARSTQLSAVYSSFAILILFLSWLYMSWLILLLGGRLGFYMQNPLWRRPEEELQPFAPAGAEASALVMMLMVAERGEEEAEHYELGVFVGQLAVPGIRLEPILEHLTTAGLLLKTRRRAYVLAREPERITVAQIMGAVRGESEVTLDRPLAELMRHGHDAQVEVFSGTTLADLAVDATTTETSPEKRKALAQNKTVKR